MHTVGKSIYRIDVLIVAGTATNLSRKSVCLNQMLTLVKSPIAAVENIK